MYRLAKFAIVLLALALVQGDADAKKLGKEFTVSKGGFLPDLTYLETGGFVAVWRDDFPYGVKAQRYNSKGKKTGGAITVDKKGPELIHPVVGGLKSGGFVVVYEDDDGSGLGVRAQIYNKKGKKAGKLIKVNKYKTDDQYYPTVDGLKNGDFAILWMSKGQDGASHAVMGRIYSKSGKARTGEFRADTSFPPASHDFPSVAATKDGGFIAAWKTLSSIRAQRFNKKGKLVGDEFITHPPEFTGQVEPEVAVLESKDFVVTREAVLEDGDANGSGVFFQRFKPNAKETGKRVVVNKDIVGFQGNQKIAALKNGSFVVIWDTTNIIHGQIFDKKGKRDGKIFEVNKTAVPSAGLPSVAKHGKKGFVAVYWTGGEIRGQRFDGK